ncbi:MAG: class I SAM-dependent methyltransferase [Ilumatobacteraceae bacterium]
MHGYGPSTYGDAFADSYDDWYAEISDIPSTVACLAGLVADGLAVLELGVGTGRLAIPLAAAVSARGCSVVGLDASAAMLRRLAVNDPSGSVAPILGEMVEAMPSGPFGLVFAAYNTFFNLLSSDRQLACFHAVAARLAPAAMFAVEAFVPGEQAMITDRTEGARQFIAGPVTLRSMTADRVVLSVSRSDHAAQVVEGQYVEITEDGGVRLRPCSIRYALPAELDAMATAAGMHLVHRWGSFAMDPFEVDSERHVSVYGL